MALFGGGVEAARLLVGVGTSGIGQAQRDLQSFGRSVSSVGGSLTGALTVPILAAGAAIVSTATDFDTALRKVIGLTNVTADEIGGVRDAILDMAATSGKAPTELADAFYFLASAGLTTKTALEVLDQSAKAAATGLGDTQTIAKVTGIALNAFSEQGLTATKALDSLIAAVREGTAEPAEFAASLGTVAGSAAQIGATFPDVTAAIAAMTIKGIDAASAAVSLNQVFVSLFKPTKEAEEALKEMGLSAGELRDMIGEQGLLPTLDLLADKFGNNEEAAAEVFGNVRALRGVFALTGGDAAKTAGIFDRVNAATGSLGDAFAATEGPGREMARGMADIQTTLIDVGQTALPLVVDLIHGLRNALAGVRQWWDSLDDGMKKNILTFAGLAAAAGPVLFIVGGLIGALGALLSPIGLVVAGVAALGYAWTTNAGGIRDAIQPIVDKTIPLLTGAFDYVTQNVLPALVAGFEFLTTQVVPRLAEVFGWIVENILPPLQQGFSAIAENVLPILRLAFQTVSDFVRDNWPTISAIAEQVGGAVKRAAEVIAAILQFVMPIIRQVAEIAFPALAAQAAVLLKAMQTSFDLIGKAGQALYDILKGAVTLIVGTFNSLVAFVSGLPGRISAAASGMWSGIWAAFRSALNMIVRAWNSLKFSIPSVDLGVLGTFGGFTIGTPDLPYFEKGAWEIPTTMPAILHPGEMVLPANLAEMLRGGGGRGDRGATTYNLIFNIGSFHGSEENARRLSELMARQLRLSTIPGS